MNKLHLNIWWGLLCRDLSILKASLWSKAVNTAIITATNLIVFAYFIPGLTTEQKYGTFIFFGAVIIFGFFDVVSNVISMLADISGDNTISYMLVLPLPPKLVFLEIITYWAASTAVIGLVMFPLGKIFLWAQLDLAAISYLRLIPAFISSCILFGAFSLWLVSIIQKISEVQTLWFRVINPLFMFGAYFFPWSEVYNYNPTLGYVLLINPLIYAMEAIRSAGLGPSEYIPFWGSMLAMWGFIIFFTQHASYKLKKWLDCP